MRSRRIALLATTGALSMVALPAAASLAAGTSQPAPKAAHSAQVHRDASRDGAKHQRESGSSTDRNSVDASHRGDSHAR
jgi:hypothetical protein